MNATYRVPRFAGLAGLIVLAALAAACLTRRVTPIKFTASKDYMLRGGDHIIHVGTSAPCSAILAGITTQGEGLKML